MTPREVRALLDVADEGIAMLNEWANRIDFTEGESDEAVRYSVRAAMGERSRELLAREYGIEQEDET